jgi:uncharacterized protein (UPF0254 family)
MEEDTDTEEAIMVATDMVEVTTAVAVITTAEVGAGAEALALASCGALPGTATMDTPRSS